MEPTRSGMTTRAGARANALDDTNPRGDVMTGLRSDEAAEDARPLDRGSSAPSETNNILDAVKEMQRQMQAQQEAAQARHDVALQAMQLQMMSMQKEISKLNMDKHDRDHGNEDRDGRQVAEGLLAIEATNESAPAVKPVVVDTTSSKIENIIDFSRLKPFTTAKYIGTELDRSIITQWRTRVSHWFQVNRIPENCTTLHEVAADILDEAAFDYVVKKRDHFNSLDELEQGLINRFCVGHSEQDSMTKLTNLKQIKNGKYIPVQKYIESHLDILSEDPDFPERAIKKHFLMTIVDALREKINDRDGLIESRSFEEVAEMAIKMERRVLTTQARTYAENLGKELQGDELAEFTDDYIKK